MPRIKRAEPTDAAFTVPDDFDLHDYVRRGVGGLQADGVPPETFRIRFTAAASPAAAERKLQADQQEEWDKEGRLTLTLTTTAIFRVMRKINEWATGVEAWERRPA